MILLPSALRFAVRRWLRRPGLALTAVLVLALGIGGTTAMFSIVNAVLLKAEPWPDADRLVRVYGVSPPQRTNPAAAATWNRGALSWASFLDVRKLPLFEDVVAWTPAEQIIGDGRPELVRAFMAFSTLPAFMGAKPLHGRFFTADEDRSDSGAVILSHGVWQRMFGADPQVIGTTTAVTFPGTSAASKSSRRIIAGVLPEGFEFPGATPDILIPIGFHEHNRQYGSAFFHTMARLRPEVSIAAAASAVDPLIRRGEPVERRTSRVIDLRSERIGAGDRPLWLMLGGAVLLLLVACANVAGLLLSDARSRQHETAVRLSLGGTRFAILRSLVSEHLLLGIAAAVSGVLAASWMLPSLVALAPPGLVGAQEVSIDRRIATWAVAAALVTTLAAGLIPAVAITRTRPGDAMKRGAREITRGGRWRHRLVVAAQFGLALILLVGAGLFAETLVRLNREPLGFVPDQVAVLAVTRSRQEPTQVLSPEERQKVIELRKTNIDAWLAQVQQRQWLPIASLLERLSAYPAVQSAAVADAVPFTASQPRAMRFRPEGQPIDAGQLLLYHAVSRDYFTTMGIRVVKGRTFEESLSSGPRIVQPGVRIPRQPIVISESVARRFFDDDALGRVMLADKAPYEVIGVVADVKQRGLLDAESGAVYRPVGLAETVRQIVLRAHGPIAPLLPDLRAMVEKHDAPLLVSSSNGLKEMVDSTVVVERSRAMLASVYGLAALLLASVGLYGLAARLVAERRREIGIRVALGAGRRHVRRLVMTDAWTIVGLGLVVGIPSAIAASRVTQGMLHGVAPTAPHVLATAAVALAIAAVIATLVPAWRATRIDPAVTLREE